ncbi:MAG: VOC family protein [Solirubrobacteraceae bacterium]|nr:VOC family protein [Solirubrobacteraceae bacterium]
MTAAAAIQITGVDFVCIPTSDHDRACEFYGGLLGLPKRQQWGDRPATEFQAGNLTLVLFDQRGFGQAQAGSSNSAPIALQVPDVDAAREALKAAGVTFIFDMIDSGVCHQAMFLDPDGNPIVIHHRYAPPTN